MPSSPRDPRPQRGSGTRGGYAVIAATVVFLALRAMVGFDPQDGSYVISLARDMSAGSMPLADEQSLQTFGSIWMVPVLWLWRTLVGDTGLILVAREFYVLVVAVVMLLCHRALARSFGSFPVAAGLAAAVLALPYAQPVLAYNTGTQLGLLVGVCAGYAAARDRSRGWAALAAVGICVAAVSFPAAAPGAALLALVTVRGIGVREGAAPARGWRRWDPRGWDWSVPAVGSFVATMVVLAAIGAAAVLFGPGLQGLKDTSEGTKLIRPNAGGWIAIVRTVRYVATMFGTVGVAIALIAAILVVTGRVRGRSVAGRPWERVLYALVGLGLVGTVLRWNPPNTQEPYGLEAIYAGVAGTLVCVALAPFLVARWRRRGADADPQFAALARRAGLVALVVGLSIQFVTASHAKHGAMPGAFAPLILVSVLAFASHAERLEATPVRAAGERHTGMGWVTLLPPLAVAISLCAVVFEEGPVWQHRERITSGPAAGLWAADATRTELEAAERALARCPDGGRDVLIVWVPGLRILTPAGTDGWTAPLTWIDGNNLSPRVTGEDNRTIRCLIAPDPLQPRMDTENFARITSGMEKLPGQEVIRRSQENVPTPFSVWVRR